MSSMTGADATRVASGARAAGASAAPGCRSAARRRRHRQRSTSEGDKWAAAARRPQIPGTRSRRRGSRWTRSTGRTGERRLRPCADCEAPAGTEAAHASLGSSTPPQHSPMPLFVARHAARVATPSGTRRQLGGEGRAAVGPAADGGGRGRAWRWARVRGGAQRLEVPPVTRVVSSPFVRAIQTAAAAARAGRPRWRSSRGWPRS